MSLPIESFAIVDATAREVQPRAAAILFRLWHHLDGVPARRMVFAEFTFDDRVVGLIEAIVLIARHSSYADEAVRPHVAVTAAQHAEAAPLLDAVLVRAMVEALGPSIPDMVVVAWRTAFRHLMRHARSIGSYPPS